MEEQSIEIINQSKAVSWILNSPNSRKHPIGYQQKGIGLALDEDEDEDEDEDFDSFSKASKSNRKMLLFGAELNKVRIPESEKTTTTTTTTTTTCDMQVGLKSPIDFGIKTKNNLHFLPQHLDLDSPVRNKEGRISLKEMELSEEYTCVMKRGNDPKIVHIFDDVIVETCCGGGGGGNLFDDMEEFKRKGNNGNSGVGICYNCKAKLGDGKDIFMYRGEKSFCSSECRFQEMIREEDVDYPN